MVKIAILIGKAGRGSNMLQLAGQIADHPDISVSAVISPVPDSPGILAAEQKGLPTVAVPYSPAESYPQRLLEALEGNDWVCLAGYMKLLPPAIINQFPNRILNIHPSLLPKFGGKGMYGSHVHEAVLAAGETETGCTVHYVNQVYDEGAVVAQSRCPVLPEDTAETLGARVLKLEHQLYFQALKSAIRSQQTHE